jgi:AP-2 complex subunit alpha
MRRARYEIEIAVLAQAKPIDADLNIFQYQEFLYSFNQFLLHFGPLSSFSSDCKFVIFPHRAFRLRQEEEQKRVDKELANIRKQFTAKFGKVGEDGSNTKLSAYQRKKYVWKLVYIHILGYDVDFGHSEIIVLVKSPDYSLKCVGYTALSLLLRSDDPMMGGIRNTIVKDLTQPTPSGKNSAPSDSAQSLALCAIANISGLELVQSLHTEVMHTLVAKSSSPCVKKKAALCLLRLARTSAKIVVGRDFAPQVALLLQDRHLGVLTSSMSLLFGLASQLPNEYESLIPYVVHIMGMLVLKKACAREYLYYRTPSPWLQIKLLKFLQLYPGALSKGENGAQETAPANGAHIPQLNSIISKILTETDVSDSINKSNADHAILFEAVNLIVCWGSSGPAQLRDGAMKLLGKFISVREPNIRYLGLMTMAKLAQLEGSAESIKKHQATVLVSLKDADISVRRRALDLLFVMCDTDNAEKIVDELVAHLVIADAAIREEMVLKIAILAEKYATDLRWYVDTILKLISISGDHVSDAIWHRVVQLVTNHPQGDLQAYTAATLLVAASPRRCHETAVRVAAYILGEFGFLIAERPGMSGEEQFRILHQHWTTSDNQTRSILLTTYAKLANLYEECRPLIAPVFARCTNSVDVEIQQRASEYSSMREAFSPEAVEDLLREMPPFEDNKTSALEQRLREKEGADSAAVVKASRPSAAERKRAAQSAAAAQALQEAQREADPEPEENEVSEDEDPVSPMSSKFLYMSNCEIIYRS